MDAFFSVDLFDFPMGFMEHSIILKRLQYHAFRRLFFPHPGLISKSALLLMQYWKKCFNKSCLLGNLMQLLQSKAFQLTFNEFVVS